MTQGYSLKIPGPSKVYRTNNLVSSTKICKKKEKERVRRLTFRLKENEQIHQAIAVCSVRIFLASDLSKVKNVYRIIKKM